MREKRPCSICRKWFLPHARVKDRQRVCSAAECQIKRRGKTQAAWRDAHPGYFAARRIQERAAAAELASTQPTEVPTEIPLAPASTPSTSSKPIARPPPPRMPRPLDGLPWDLAQDQFGAQGADFIGVFGRLLLRASQDQMRSQEAEIT